MAEVVATWLALTNATVLPAGVARDANSTSDPATQTHASTTADASTSSKITSACKLTHPCPRIRIHSLTAKKSKLVHLSE